MCFHLTLRLDILLIAFAVGVWFSADHYWVLRVMACLLAGNAVFYMIAGVFFSLHSGEPVNTPANTMNTIFVAVSMFLFLLAIGFGAAGNHNWFRYYSIGTLLVFLVLTILGSAVWIRSKVACSHCTYCQFTGYYCIYLGDCQRSNEDVAWLGWNHLVSSDHCALHMGLVVLVQC